MNRRRAAVGRNMSKVARGKNEKNKKKTVKKAPTTTEPNKPNVEPNGRTVSKSRARVESDPVNKQPLVDAAEEQTDVSTLVREKR